jgi:hypothetical protein
MHAQGDAGVFTGTLLCLTVAATELCTLGILIGLAAKHKAASYQALVRDRFLPSKP